MAESNWSPLPPFEGIVWRPLDSGEHFAMPRFGIRTKHNKKAEEESAFEWGLGQVQVERGEALGLKVDYLTD